MNIGQRFFCFYLILANFLFLSQACAEEPAWKENSLIQPFPSHASPVRLSLPVSIDDIMLGPKYHFQGFGAHVGDRSEGVEVVAFAIKPKTLIRSLADGTVVDVIEGNAYMGYQVQIDYGSGLSGRHHYLKNCLVNRGQSVKKGQALGEGNYQGNALPTVEFLLKDRNRTDGARSEFGEGSAVSMFDYLNNIDQKAFIALYEKEIIIPYISKGKNAGGVTLWEPFLTNKVLIHKGNKGKLTGEWLLVSRWAQDGKPDVISFLDVDHEYYKGKYMRAIDAYNWDAILMGHWQADYSKNRIKITGEKGTFYCIFRIDESGDQAVLKFEYQKDSYPAAFTHNASTYIEREPVNMYDQARQMHSI